MYGLWSFSPAKRKSTAMYAVPAWKCDGAIWLMLPRAGRWRFAVTSIHCGWPCDSASFVYHTLPSLVPAHSKPFSIGENASDHTSAPKYWPRLSCMMPPLGTISDGSRVERSGLNSVHECPLSVVRSTIWQPYKTLPWSKGSIASGGVQWQRYFSLSGGESSPTTDGETECGVPCARSKRYSS